MFPFDKYLTERIKILERTVEILTGQNQILERELESAKFRESELKERLFTLAGLDPKVPKQVQTPSQPVQLSKSLNWKKVQQNLELEARQKYWENKKKQQEGEVDLTGISELEKELKIAEEKENAS